MAKAMMKVLSNDEIELVHQSSLSILSEVGVKIDSPSRSICCRTPGQTQTGRKVRFFWTRGWSLSL